MVQENTPRRYKLTIEYDGTNFSGWQKQKDARTVQGDLLKGATRVFGDTDIDIQGCGRTDAGVHALEFVAHLEVVSELNQAEVAKELNDTLPKDIAIISAEDAGPRFHARHNCVARSYVYKIRKRKSAFGKRYDWWVREELKLALMIRAGDVLVGMHDYASFAEKKELKKSTKVLVHDVQVTDDGEFITILVVGSHFLWRMVRRIVGVLVEAGCRRLTENDIGGFLVKPSTIPANHTAPGAGLFFEKAFYSDEELQQFLVG